MTQRKAVVPIEPTYEMCCAGGFPWETPHFPSRYKAMITASPDGGGKLTRAQVEAMAEAHFNNRQNHIKEFSGYDGPKWSDVDTDTQVLGRRDMIAALKIAGIEVEG